MTNIEVQLEIISMKLKMIEFKDEIRKLQEEIYWLKHPDDKNILEEIRNKNGD